MKTKKNKRPIKSKPLLFIILFALVGLFALIIVKAAAVYSPPTSIAADCSVDVTATLNSWIKSVPDGSTIDFKANGCYHIDGTLTLTNRHNLVLNGQSATFKAFTTGDRTRSQWSTSGGTNLTFENMIIRGANPNAGTGESAYVASLEAQHAFNIIATRGVTVKNNQAYDLYGDFVYFGGNSSSWSGNATVTGNHFDRNGRQGISVTGGDHITITNNYIYNVRRTTFDIEPNTSSGGGYDITIDHNDIGPSRLNFLSDAGAAGNVHDITVSNNTIKDAMVIEVKPPSGRRSNFFIVNNTSTNAYGSPSGAAMIFDDVDNVQVRNNTQPLQTGRNMAGVKLSSSTGAVITGNTFVNGTAIYTSSGSKITTYCGNRLTATGDFTIPEVCPVTPPPGGPTPPTTGGGTTPPVRTGSSSSASSTPKSSMNSSGSSVTSVNSNQGSNVTSSPAAATKALLTNPVKGVKSFSSLVKNSHASINARLIAFIVISAIIVALSVLVWWIVRKLRERFFGIRW